VMAACAAGITTHAISNTTHLTPASPAFAMGWRRLYPNAQDVLAGAHCAMQ